MKKLKGKRLTALFLCVVLVLQIVLPQNAVITFAKEGERNVVFEDDSFQVEFQIEAEWENHYKAEIVITNTGSETMKNWMIEYLSEDQYEQIWNGVILSSGDGIYQIKMQVIIRIFCQGSL